MTERTGQHEELVELSDSTLRLEVPEQDVRGPWTFTTAAVSG